MVIHDLIEVRGTFDTFILIRGGVWTDRSALKESGINSGAGRAALALALSDGLRNGALAPRLRSLAFRLHPGFGSHGQLADDAVVQVLMDAVRHRNLIVFRRPHEACSVEPLDQKSQTLLKLSQPRLPNMGGAATKRPAATLVLPPLPPIRSVSAMSLSERFEAMLRRVPPYLPASMRAEFARLLEPDVLASAAGVLAVWGIAQVTPVGWIADIVMVAVGGYMLGLAAYEAGSLFGEAIALIVRAKTDADLELVARKFADAVAIMGVSAFVTLLVKGGAKAARARGAASAPKEPTAHLDRPASNSPGKPTPQSRPATSPAKTLPQHKVPCFHPYDKDKFKKLSADQQRGYLRELANQLKRQEDAINSISAADYSAARDAFVAHGRNPVAGLEQANFRDRFESDIRQSIRESLQQDGMGAAQAKAAAAERAKQLTKSLDALHEPDLAAGGWLDPKPKAMGRSDINQSIGGSWNQRGRLEAMDNAARDAVQAGNGHMKMNVALEPCRGSGMR